MQRFIATAGVFFLTLLGLLAGGCGAADRKSEDHQQKETKTECVVLTRRTLSEIKLTVCCAELKAIEREIVVPAKLVANQDNEAWVGTFVQGRVTKVSANLGDRVVKGQELMHIEGVEIGEIKSLFIKAKAQLTYAEGALKRQRMLIEQNAGSQKALLEAQAEYEKAHAEFIAEDRRIHSIGLDDNDIEGLDQASGTKREAHIGGILPVKAPIGGVVVERNVAIGQLVDPATTAFRIVNSSVLWVDGQLHENEANEVPKNAAISVVIPSMPEKDFPASLLYIGETIDPQSRMVKIRAEVRNTQRLFKPEMFADMHVRFTGTSKSVVVNAGCVVRDGAEQYVFVAVNDTTFEKRNVVVGAAAGEQMEITKGVRTGEKVVNEGAFLLKSEMKKSTFAEED